MPDINLLEDTRETDESAAKKLRKAPPAPVEYSFPGAHAASPSQLKKPSAFSLWFRSFFRRQPPGDRQQRPEPAKPDPSRRRSPPTAQRGPEPEDIFADIASVPGGPSAKKAPTAREFAAGTGPRPGDFPPLPTIPAMPGRGAVVRLDAAPPPRPAAAPPQRSVPAVPPPPTPPRRGLRLPPLPPRKQSLMPGEASSGLGVNLLPEELVSTFDPKKKLTTIGLVALASALMVGIVDVSLLLWKETQVRKTEEKKVEVSDVLTKIKSLEKEQRQAIALKSANDVYRQLLNRHVYWTKLLALFERNTLPTVFYSSGLRVSVDGALSLTGSAPDIETIVQQEQVYEKASELFKSVKIADIKREGDRYKFAGDFVLAPNAFYDPIDAATVDAAAPSNANPGANINATPATP